MQPTASASFPRHRPCRCRPSFKQASHNLAVAMARRPVHGYPSKMVDLVLVGTGFEQATHNFVVACLRCYVQCREMLLTFCVWLGACGSSNSEITVATLPLTAALERLLPWQASDWPLFWPILVKSNFNIGSTSHWAHIFGQTSLKEKARPVSKEPARC